MIVLSLMALALSAPLQPGDAYVAMGSSYAAGPGITTPADTPPTRCARSNDNYAHQLARTLKLTLADVSCSGAVTANLTSPWGELPAEVDAVTAQTRLVTVTIGGNDLAFVANLYNASCAAAGGQKCGDVHWPDEAAYKLDGEGLHRIVAAIRQRSPAARIVFVDYPTVLPDHGTCARAPMTEAQADALRDTARRLAALTAEVAKGEGVDLLKASELTHGHDACAAEPWMAGYLDDSGQKVKVPYHPNLAGMTAIADALAAKLGR